MTREGVIAALGAVTSPNAVQTWGTTVTLCGETSGFLRLSALAPPMYGKAAGQEFKRYPPPPRCCPSRCSWRRRRSCRRARAGTSRGPSAATTRPPACKSRGGRSFQEVLADLLVRRVSKSTKNRRGTLYPQACGEARMSLIPDRERASAAAVPVAAWR